MRRRSRAPSSASAPGRGALARLPGSGGAGSVSDAGGEEQLVFGESERGLGEGARGQSSGRLVDKVLDEAAGRSFSIYLGLKGPVL